MILVRLQCTRWLTHYCLVTEATSGVKKLSLIDRDGTIIVEKNYLSSPDQVELLEGAVEGIQLLRRLGYVIVVVTNQSAVGRGYFSLATLEKIHQRLRNLLSARGASLDAIYVCPHHPDDGCSCRKPAPGLAWKAATEFRADLVNSIVVGDKACDIELGKQVGAQTILVRTGYGASVAIDGKTCPDYVAKNLIEAAHIIQKLPSDIK